MSVRLLTEPEDFQHYAKWLEGRHEKTLWQSDEWKKYQQALGREVRMYVNEHDGRISASALVIIDTTSFGLSTWDIPRGPLFTKEEHGRELAHFLLNEAKKSNCMSLTFSPLQPLKHARFRESLRHEQPEATRVLSLQQTDDQILEQMKQKGRYNIRLTEKNGVTVKQSDDVAAFHELVKGTGDRDAFGVHTLNHYEKFLRDLPGSFLMLAYEDSDHAKKPIAGLMGVIWGNTGIYYYGASGYAHRQLMATYALQWAAIKYCKLSGCTEYDLLGIAPSEVAETHPWHGITAFKEKFGGKVVSYPAEQEVVLKPLVRTLLKLKRRIVG